MFEDVAVTEEETPLGSYVDSLRETIDSIGRDHIVAETTIEPAVLEEIASGDTETVGSVHLSEVAEILALQDGENPESLLRSTREELLFEMSAAVTDVEALTARMDTDLDPKEIQAKLEGRFPMTLGEYVRLRSALLS